MKMFSTAFKYITYNLSISFTIKLIIFSSAAACKQFRKDEFSKSPTGDSK